METGNHNTRMAYSIDEAADALRISRSSLKVLLKDGKLRGVHIGRRIVIPADEVSRLLGGVAQP